MSKLIGREVRVLVDSSKTPPRSRMEAICRDLELELELDTLSNEQLHTHLREVCAKLLEESSMVLKKRGRPSVYPDLEDLSPDELRSVYRYVLSASIELELG